MALPDLPPSVIILAGPTGIGKSRLALDLADRCGGEIVSADSLQVYRSMDIGTSKPTPGDRARVRHHLIDVVDPDEPFHAALYASLARAAVADIHRRRRPVFVVGGTGLYIKALLGGMFSGPGPDAQLRTFYRDEVRRRGEEYLYRLLEDRDPKAARQIDPHDTVRIIRALEVWDTCGCSIVDKQKEHQFRDRRYRCLKIGLTADRAELYDRIERRTEEMISAGLVGEVENLLARGYAASLKPMQALGYRHISRHLQGLYDLAEAVRLIKRDTRNYAKRQLTWFRADREMRWFSPEDAEGVGNLLRNFLTSGGDEDN